MVLRREFNSQVRLKTRWIRRTTWWQNRTKIIKTAKRGKSHQKKNNNNIRHCKILFVYAPLTGVETVCLYLTSAYRLHTCFCKPTNTFWVIHKWRHVIMTVILFMHEPYLCLAQLLVCLKVYLYLQLFKGTVKLGYNEQLGTGHFCSL
jgi:hypothetical protein